MTADQFDLNTICSATHFVVFLQTNSERYRSEFNTYQEAAAHAETLPKSIRKPLIYAVNERGRQALVTADLAKIINL